MMLSAEISMYPLAESYIPQIEGFIEKLNPLGFYSPQLAANMGE